MAKSSESNLPATINAHASIEKVYGTLPDNYKESLAHLAKKSNPRKKGLSDEVESASWNPPSVRVMQPTTRNTSGAEGVQPGDMFTSLGRRIGTELLFIPFYRFTTHTRWDDGDFGGAPNCSSPGAIPGQPRLSIFGTKCDDCPDLPFRDGHKTSCNKNMVYWVLDANTMSDIYSIQFSKTSYRVGSRIYSLAKGQESTWARTFKLSTVKQTTSRGIYYKYDVTLGDETDVHQRGIADAFYDMVHEQRNVMLQRLVDRAAAKAEEAAGGSEEGDGEEVAVDFTM